MIEDFSVVEHELISTFLCLNPFCSQIKRIFNSSDEPGHQECGKWIIDAASAQSTNKTLIAMDQFRRLQVNFTEKPIQWIFNSFEAKDICKCELKNYIQRLREQIQVTLNKIMDVINIKIDTYFDPLINYYKEIKNFLSSLNQNTTIIKPEILLHQIISQSKFINYKAENVVFRLDTSVTEMQSQILNIIDGLPEKLFCYQKDIASDIGLSHIEREDLIKYMKNSTDDHNKKWHKLTALLKVDKKLLYDKRQKYNKATEIFIKCPICHKMFLTEIRREVMGLWDEFSDHLFEKHLEEVGYHFKHLIIGKKYNSLTCVEWILYMMINYSYEGLELIYRSGRKNYNFSYANCKKLSIEILGKGQSRIHPIRQLQTQQAHEFYSIVSVICYSLHKSPVHKKLVYIYTNNSVEASNLQKLSHLLGIKNMVIQSEKRVEDGKVVEAVEQKNFMVYEDACEQF